MSISKEAKLRFAAGAAALSFLTGCNPTSNSTVTPTELGRFSVVLDGISTNVRITEPGSAKTHKVDYCGNKIKLINTTPNPSRITLYWYNTTTQEGETLEPDSSKDFTSTCVRVGTQP